MRRRAIVSLLLALSAWNGCWHVVQYRRHFAFVGDQKDDLLLAPEPIATIFSEEQIGATSKIQISDIMNERLTIITGYWRIPGNTKNPVEEFLVDVRKGLNFFVQWASRSNVQVHFHHNIPDTEPHASPWKKLLDEYSNTSEHLQFKYTPFASPSLLQHQARQLVKQCELQDLPSYGELDKALQHKEQLAKVVETTNSTDAWVDVIAVWISKLELIRRTLKAHTGDSKRSYLGWIDAALHSTLLAGLEPRFFDSKHVWFRPSPMSLNHSKILFRAGVILGHVDVMRYLVDDYRLELQDIISTDHDYLCYDEEGILTRMWNRNPKPYIAVWRKWENA